MNNDFQVLINNCNEEELIDLKNQFEEKADYVLFENKILEDELKTNHVKFMDHRNSYELKSTCVLLLDVESGRQVQALIRRKSSWTRGRRRDEQVP